MKREDFVHWFLPPAGTHLTGEARAVSTLPDLRKACGPCLGYARGWKRRGSCTDALSAFLWERGRVHSKVPAPTATTVTLASTPVDEAVQPLTVVQGPERTTASQTLAAATQSMDGGTDEWMVGEPSEEEAEYASKQWQDWSEYWENMTLR
jgi:hypothetical protein